MDGDESGRMVMNDDDGHGEWVGMGLAAGAGVGWIWTGLDTVFGILPNFVDTKKIFICQNFILSRTAKKEFMRMRNLKSQSYSPWAQYE
jgi:hypothetical protein